MEIVTASLLDLNALSKLEHACFEKDAWPFLDLLNYYARYLVKKLLM